MAINKTTAGSTCCSYYHPKVGREPGTPFKTQFFVPPAEEDERFFNKDGKVLDLTPEEEKDLSGKKDTRDFFTRLIDWFKSFFARLFGSKTV